jgi:hypothetical protein
LAGRHDLKLRSCNRRWPDKSDAPPSHARAAAPGFLRHKGVSHLSGRRTYPLNRLDAVFQTWEMRGRYKAVIDFWPTNSVGEDIKLYTGNCYAAAAVPISRSPISLPRPGAARRIISGLRRHFGRAGGKIADRFAKANDD